MSVNGAELQDESYPVADETWLNSPHIKGYDPSLAIHGLGRASRPRQTESEATVDREPVVPTDVMMGPGFSDDQSF